MAGQNSDWKIGFRWGLLVGLVVASSVLLAWAGCQREASAREVHEMRDQSVARERKLYVRMEELDELKNKAEQSAMEFSRMAAESQSKAQYLEGLARAAESKRATVASEDKNVVRLLALSREVEGNLRLACREKDRVIANLNLTIASMRQAQEVQDKENKELRDAREMDALEIDRLRDIASKGYVAPAIGKSGFVKHAVIGGLATMALVAIVKALGGM